MAGNCDATNGAGRSNAPTPGWVSSAAYWSVTTICSPSTAPSSISLVSGSHCANVFETRSSHSSESRRLILRVAEPGEILGLSSAFTGSPYQMTAETLHACTVASVRRPEFLEFLNRHPAAYRGVACELSLRQDQVCARLRTLGLTHATSAKLGRLLLEWSANGLAEDAGARIHLTLTRGEIAECIATSRETVTRILNDFPRRGIVQVHGETLTVVDRTALETCSDMW